MKKIPLTQGQEAIVDDWWYEYLSKWKWWAQWNPATKSFYAVREETKKPRKMMYMHRVVANTPGGMLCDHIYHNTLDNREEKLRNVTPSQSSVNRKSRTDNTSGVKGVRKSKNYHGFWAQLTIGGKMVLSKGFRTFEEAVEARKNAEKEYHKEFSFTQEELS